MFELIIGTICGFIIGACFAGYWWIVRLWRVEQDVQNLLNAVDESVLDIAVTRHEIEEIQDRLRSSPNA